MPRSITIHNIDDVTAQWLADEAERRGMDMETIAGQLLTRGLEWARRQAELATYHDLDALAGTWSEDEATAFLQQIAHFEQADAGLWP